MPQNIFADMSRAWHLKTMLPATSYICKITCGHVGSLKQYDVHDTVNVYNVLQLACMQLEARSLVSLIVTVQWLFARFNQWPWHKQTDSTVFPVQHMEMRLIATNFLGRRQWCDPPM